MSSSDQEATTSTQDSSAAPAPPNGDGDDVHCLVSKFERLELDRFIPNRSTTNWDYGRAVLTERLPSERCFGDIGPGMKETNVSHILKLKRELNIDTSRIFHYRNNRKPPEEVAVYSPRKQPTSLFHDRSLDAPGLVADEIYLNLLDWGTHNNVVAIALKEKLLFHRVELDEMGGGFDFDEDETISSVGWSPECLEIAIGLKNSVVQLWNPYTLQQLRTFTSRGVGSLAWNGRILTTGNVDGRIVNYDPRVGPPVSRLPESHRGAICGIKWSPSGQLLASGGSDNVVYVWDTRSTQTRWLHKLEDHNATVRAIAWNPLKRHFLASGGGLGDHYIRLWDARSGTPHENAVDTGAEVCGLFWSQQYRDVLFSAHGFGGHPSVSDNRLTLWRSPMLFRIDMNELIIDYVREQDRRKPFFHSTQSPDGFNVALAGNDEMLKYYQVFAEPPPPPQPEAKPPFSTYNGPNRYTLR